MFGDGFSFMVVFHKWSKHYKLDSRDRKKAGKVKSLVKSW